MKEVDGFARRIEKQKVYLKKPENKSEKPDTKTNAIAV